jgi:LPXTG-motif cell wall-anchored protein
MVKGIVGGFASLFGQTPVGQQIVGGGGDGTIGGGLTVSPPKTGVFGGSNMLIFGVLGVGAAAAIYYAYKKSSEPKISDEEANRMLGVSRE